jgi:hypothetical protein
MEPVTTDRPKRAYNRRPPVDAVPQRVRPIADDAEAEGLADELGPAMDVVMRPDVPHEGPSRPDMRAPLRAEDPRDRARRRAEEIRQHAGGSMDDGMDEFYIPAHAIPDGWTYEWKRLTVLGQEDPAYQVSLAQKGWEPVPASRHPEMMPQGWSGDTIDRKGQRLFERPREITDEAKSIEMRRARQQVRIKEAQLSQAPDGQFGRDHAQVKPRISKGYEPMPIPADE